MLWVLIKSMQFKWVPTTYAFKEVDKKYTGCILKTTELLDCAVIGVCAVIRSNKITTLFLDRLIPLSGYLCTFFRHVGHVSLALKVSFKTVAEDILKNIHIFFFYFFFFQKKKSGLTFHVNPQSHEMQTFLEKIKKKEICFRMSSDATESGTLKV